jgi:hypothetical protein
VSVDLGFCRERTRQPWLNSRGVFLSNYRSIRTSLFDIVQCRH